MHVICKGCNAKIEVSSRPDGTTNVANLNISGGVHIGGGGIGFGPGGSVGFGPGGVIGFGPPTTSSFICMACGRKDGYLATEIRD